MQKKIIEYIKKTENPYQLKVGDMVINIEYSENQKKFNECMLNILKQKRRKNNNNGRKKIKEFF